MRRQGWIAAAALVLAATSSTGCFWIAVGGAGALGYEVGKDDRSIGVKFDDASITTGVKTRFINDEKVDALDINVDTYEGIVTLNGSAPNKRVEKSGDSDRARCQRCGRSALQARHCIALRSAIGADDW